MLGVVPPLAAPAPGSGGQGARSEPEQEGEAEEEGEGEEEWEHRSWGEMGAAEHAAAQVLGWTQGTWDASLQDDDFVDQPAAYVNRLSSISYYQDCHIMGY